MGLITTSLFSAISTATRILTGFLINKILALYVGPTGVAIIGQFSNYTPESVTGT